MSPSALASPASLKGCLSAAAAAAALVEGFERGGVEARAMPVADGGEGTIEVLAPPETRRFAVHDAFGRPREAVVGVLGDGTVLVEAAQVIPLDQTRLDVTTASSRGLGELLGRLGGVPRLLVGLGGTANMDAGAGLLEVLDELPAPTRVLYDVATRLEDAPRLFGPQKGATPEHVTLLERRFREDARLAPYACLAGSGAAGGLGAALASLGAALLPGAPTVLELLGFDPSPFSLVVTGEGTVDETTFEGKAPAAVVNACRDAGVRCVVFGGRVESGDAVALSGRPERAADDLRALGTKLADSLLGAA